MILLAGLSSSCFEMCKMSSVRDFCFWSDKRLFLRGIFFQENEVRFWALKLKGDPQLLTRLTEEYFEQLEVCCLLLDKMCVSKEPCLSNVIQVLRLCNKNNRSVRNLANETRKIVFNYFFRQKYLSPVV